MELEHMVRTRDPETSWDAAMSISEEKLSKVDVAILDLLAEKPRTDEELFVVYVTRGYTLVTPQRIRTARAHLVRANKVRDTNTTRKSRLGRKSTVWETVTNN